MGWMINRQRGKIYLLLHEASKLLDISIGRKEKVVGSFDSNQHEYIQFDKLLINDLITLELKFVISLLKILSMYVNTLNLTEK